MHALLFVYTFATSLPIQLFLSVSHPFRLYLSLFLIYRQAPKCKGAFVLYYSIVFVWHCALCTVPDRTKMKKKQKELSIKMRKSDTFTQFMCAIDVWSVVTGHSQSSHNDKMIRWRLWNASRYPLLSVSMNKIRLQGTFSFVELFGFM